MGVMVGVLLTASLLLAAPQVPTPRVQAPRAQAPQPQPSPARGAAGQGVPSVQFDAGGWPVVTEGLGAGSLVTPLPAGAGSRPLEVGADRSVGADTFAPVPLDRAPAPAPLGEGAASPGAGHASGMDIDSELIPVFQFVRPPGVFRALAGRRVWWRITVYDREGRPLGIRELTQVVDCGSAARDRLEHEQSGRVFLRCGGTHYAMEQGFPWPGDAEKGRHELALFGMQFRFPWCFGDARSYMVEKVDMIERHGERLKRVQLRQLPPPSSDILGPVPDPQATDCFEILFEPVGGRPRELVHRFADAVREGGGARRVLFEDWSEYGGVRLPRKRTYVDEGLRPTTVLEILDVQEEPVTERTFRP